MGSSVLDSTLTLLEQGLFRRAHDELKRVYDRADPRHRAVMGELLWRFGDLRAAREILLPLARSDVQSIKARVLESLTFVARAEGRLEQSSEYGRKAVEVAERCGDPYQLCRARLALFGITLDVEGALACESQAIRVRREVLRSGEPFLVSYLHCRFAEYEARRGALDRAFRHIEAGLRTGEKQPNLWVEGNLWVVKSATEALNGQLRESLASASKASEIAATSGHRPTQLSSLANAGYVAQFVGESELAERALKEAERIEIVFPNIWIAIQDSKAQLELLRGATAECRRVLSEIEEFVRTGATGRESWPSLEARLTRARLLRSEGQSIEALAAVESGLRSVKARGDRPLQVEYELERIDLLSAEGRTAAAWSALEELERGAGTPNLARIADFSWARGRLFQGSGDVAAAERELACADRIWHELGGHSPHRRIEAVPIGLRRSNEDREYSISSGNALAILHSGSRPLLLAEEVSTLLRPGDAVRAVKLVGTTAGKNTTLWERPMPGCFARHDEGIRLALGQWKDTHYSLFVDALSDRRSKDLVKAVATLAEAAVDLEAHRQQEKFRTSLWPPDEDLMLGGHIYIAPRMRELVAATRRIAPTDLPVLITGETGTGKEVIAREVHDASHRAKKPFAAFVCSAVPRETLDSHLFGHRRGAFTGAVDNFLGVIRANDGGTLFLDEIAEISPDLQTKLLRFLETGEVHPLGETRPVKANVRVVAATNQPLEQLLADGRFREDFYYRLNVMRFHLPPLRERREEILPLIDHFLTRECSQLGKPVPALSDEAVEHLLLHRWPGNIRQLYNEIRRIAATIETGVSITPDILAPEIVAERRAATAAAPGPSQILIRLDQSLQAGLEELERAMIHHALANSEGHLETAARRLSITRKGLFLKRQRLEIV